MYNGKQVNVLVPILNQYKLVPQFLEHLAKGTVVPDLVMFFDNGKNIASVPDGDYSFELSVLTPEKNVGTARAWNEMIKRTKEERIILNDDIFVNTDTLEKLVSTPGGIVGCSRDSGINYFSAFLLRDSCIEKVGYFDELISPNYGYFEDGDYARRIIKAGLTMERADCGAVHYHGGSQTMKSLSPSKLVEHHMKFEFAKKNYIRKWGGEPGYEVYDEEYNGKK